jgi:hypothetical protein
VKPTSVQREIFDDFRREVPDQVENLIPLVLDNIDKQWQWYGGAAVLVILALGGLWGVITFVQRSSNPQNHPTMKKLARFGEIDQVAESIEAELDSLIDEVGKLKLTRNWVVYATGSSFDAIPYRDLVWVYKMIKKGKYSTKSYFAHIADKHGTLLEVPAKEPQVDTMLQGILGRIPWILAGYSDDIKQAWNRDRQQLVAAVEQRKAQFEAQKP